MISKLRAKIILIMLLFSVFLLISGCSTSSIFPGTSKPSYINTPKVDTTGDGLDVNLKLDNRWIGDKLVGYDLSLKNSGIEPIKLSKDNFKISTLEILNGNKYVISNFNSFYSKVFQNGDLTLYHDQSLPSFVNGEFEINEEYFKDLTKNDFTILLNINYPYKTEFANNVVLNMKTKTLNVKNSLSQAAPINVKKIILKPTINNGIYEIGFYIRDTSNSMFGSFSNLYREADFTNMNFKFGTIKLNDCSLWKEKDSVLQKVSDNLNYNSMVLNNKNNRELVVVCKIDLRKFKNQETISTIVSGELDYKYYMRFSKKIELPEIRTGKNTWS